ARDEPRLQRRGDLGGGLDRGLAAPHLVEDLSGELDVVDAVATVEDDGLDARALLDAEGVGGVGRLGGIAATVGRGVVVAAATGGAGRERDPEGHGGRREERATQHAPAGDGGPGVRHGGGASFQEGGTVLAAGRPGGGARWTGCGRRSAP